MTTKSFGFGLLVGATAIASLTLPAAAQAPASALTGKVSSQAEGAMEGVIVSAKRAGSNITISVVSDAQGQYRFPKDRLAPGKYDVSIRAVGYDLSEPASVDVGAAAPAQLDLTLNKTAKLWTQLSNAEWLMSMPGPEKEKNALGQGCVTCHTLRRTICVWPMVAS